MSLALVPAEAVYKGATRPPTLCGVPLLCFLAVAGGGFLIGMYAMVLGSWPWGALAAAACVAILSWMRAVTRRDDQRLHQGILLLRLQSACSNRRFWRCRAYSQFPYREGADAWRG